MGSSGDTFSELFLSCRTLLTLEEALVEVDKVERLALSSPMSFFAALSIGLSVSGCLVTEYVTGSLADETGLLMGETSLLIGETGLTGEAGFLTPCLGVLLVVLVVLVVIQRESAPPQVEEKLSCEGDTADVLPVRDDGARVDPVPVALGVEVEGFCGVFNFSGCNVDTIGFEGSIREKGVVDYA